MLTLNVFVQWMMETQSRRIDDLVERVRQQQDKLDKQNVRLQALQAEVKKKTAYCYIYSRQLAVLTFSVFCTTLNQYLPFILNVPLIQVKQRRLKSVVTRKVEDFSVDGMLERASPSNGN